MSEIAAANGIKVILASITPADHYNWQPAVHPVEEIRELNGWIRQFCSTGACTYLDYYSAMSDPNGAMLPSYSKDGVHPTITGYAVMAPLAEKAIAKALQP
jgi:acyl-CoA thioesterase I